MEMVGISAFLWLEDDERTSLRDGVISQRLERPEANRNLDSLLLNMCMPISEMQFKSCCVFTEMASFMHPPTW